MQFMRVTADDHDEIFALYALCKQCEGCTWDEYYPGEGNFREDIAHRALYVLKSRGKIVAAMSGGFPCEMQEFAMWDVCRKPAEIARVAVHPDYQGKGLGGKIMRLTLAALCGKGHDSVRLTVSPGNAAARHLYEKSGFAYRGFARRYGQIWLCMERKLQAASLYERKPHV